jgi:hypothetical protein
VSGPLPTPTCQHRADAGADGGTGPACARAADYEVRPVEAGQARTRAFCAEHAPAGIAAVRRSAEASRVDYEVVALRPDLPELAFWPASTGRTS